jgi:hypothetical protein
MVVPPDTQKSSTSLKIWLAIGTSLQFLAACFSNSYFKKIKIKMFFLAVEIAHS